MRLKFILYKEANMNFISCFFLLCSSAALIHSEEIQWKTPMGVLPPNHSSRKISKHIVAGSPASLGMFPWQAALLLQKPAGWSLCGGSLIHPQWVLTAAHCTIGATLVQVRLGTLVYNSGVANIANTTNAIITHPGYNSTNLVNDIALVKLPAPVTLSANVKVIKIAPSGLAFSALTVSGWGKTCDNCSTSLTLNYAAVNAIPNSNCSAVYGTTTVNVNSVCTRGTPKESPCSGDSGGPLIQNGTTPYLVGVVSFVSGFGCENNLTHPAGYVRATNYCPWIEGYTGILCPTSATTTQTTTITTTTKPTTTSIIPTTTTTKPITTTTKPITTTTKPITTTTKPITTTTKPITTTTKPITTTTKPITTTTKPITTTTKPITTTTKPITTTTKPITTTTKPITTTTTIKPITTTKASTVVG